MPFWFWGSEGDMLENTQHSTFSFGTVTEFLEETVLCSVGGGWERGSSWCKCDVVMVTPTPTVKEKPLFTSITLRQLHPFPPGGVFEGMALSSVHLAVMPPCTHSGPTKLPVKLVQSPWRAYTLGVLSAVWLWYFIFSKGRKVSTLCNIH